MRVEFVFLLLVLNGSVEASLDGPPVDTDRGVQVQKFFQEKKFAEAAILIRSVLQESDLGVNDALPYVLQLSEALSRSGRREEALVLLGQFAGQTRGLKQSGLLRRAGVLARAFFSEAAYKTHQEGVNLLRASKNQPALDKFNSVFLSEPDNVEVLMRMGQCFLNRSEVDRALEKFRQARRLLQYEPEVQLWLGRALYLKKDFIEAQESLSTAYKTLKKSEISALWYSEALWVTGQKNRALRILDEDIQHYPKHFWSLARWSQYKLSSNKEPGLQISVKKAVQAALSQASEYSETRLNETEFSSGLTLIRREELESELKSVLLQRE